MASRASALVPPRARSALAASHASPYAHGVTALRSLTALLLALFVAGAGVQDSVLTCRTLNTTHRSCCCKHSVRLPALGDELARAPCCDAAAHATTAIPPSTRAGADFQLAPPARTLVPLLAAMVLQGEPAPTPARAASTALTTGPPLHLKKRVLLL